MALAGKTHNDRTIDRAEEIVTQDSSHAGTQYIEWRWNAEKLRAKDSQLRNAAPIAAIVIRGSTNIARSS